MNEHTELVARLDHAARVIRDRDEWCELLADQKDAAEARVAVLETALRELLDASESYMPNTFAAAMAGARRVLEGDQ